jgi:arsenite/tail-anchored protein-transporting ATPase
MINKKLLLFGGKGGVGKTTCAAATALYFASSGKKTLLVSTDPAHSLSDSLNVQIGSEVRTVKKNLDALEIDAALLLEDYKKAYGEIIKQIADEGTFFSKDDIKQFFDLSLPGIDELMALMKIMDVLDEKKYDTIILDTAPTGHTIRLLELPQVMLTYMHVLAEMRLKHKVVVRMMVGRYIKDKADEFINDMNNRITRLQKVLTSNTTAFIPVVTPEKMAVAETERLVTILKKDGIHIEFIILNRVIAKSCAFCTKRAASQTAMIRRVKRLHSSIKEIPLLALEVRGKYLDSVSAILYTATELYTPNAMIHHTSEKTNASKGATVTFTSLKITNSTQFLLFGGKGGVGKTSCAAAAALHEGTKKKVLVFSTDPAHSLSDAFGKKIGDSVTPITPNVDALEIQSMVLLEQLKKKYKTEMKAFFGSVFRSTTTATIDAPYDRKVMEDLFELCPPGVDELMALKTMMDFMNEKKYDLFILDTAPTGHTLRLLEMPEIAEAWLETLADIQDKYPLSLELGETLQSMLDTVKKLRSIMTDTSKTAFVVVSIPEAMSVLETSDLTAALTRLRVPSSYIIVNKIIPESSCDFCKSKRAEQQVHIQALHKMKKKLVAVSLFDSDISDMKQLQQLGKQLY